MLIDRIFTAVYAPASGVASNEPAADDTVRTVPHAVIEEIVEASLTTLARLPTTPRTRELRCIGEGYRRAIQSWEAVPPSEPQRRTMRELAFALHAQVTQALDNARRSRQGE